MRPILPALVISFVAAAAIECQAMEIAGPARVVDGDTLEIGPQAIRIYGIDAPNPPRHANSAEQLLHWPNTPKRDKAAKLIADANAGKAKISDAKKALEAAAKEAKVLGSI
jgi:endonuclease YncB( thermonuclease family)